MERNPSMDKNHIISNTDILGMLIPQLLVQATIKSEIVYLNNLSESMIDLLYNI